MRNSDPNRLLRMFILMVTAADVHQYPSILLQPGNEITTIHAQIIHIIHIQSSINGSIAFWQ